MSRRLLTITLYLSLLCPAAPAFATNIAWKAASSGSWSVGTNWVGNQAPGVNDVAIITVAGTYDVNINSSVSVNAISLGSSARLKVNGVTLTTTTGIAVGASATLELNTAILNGGGVALNGKLSSSGTSNVNVTLQTATTSTIEVPAGSLTVADGFTNVGLLSFPATGVRYFFVTNGTFTNAPAGTVSCATNGSLIANLDNQGTITATGAQGFLTLGKSGGTSANSGSMSATGGAYLILNGFGDTITTSGNLTADAQSIVRVSGGVFHQTGGTISGSGNFELVSTTSAMFVSNPTTANLYLAGDGIVFPGNLVNGSAQHIILGDGADVTAPQLTNQAGYTLQVSEGFDALHVGTFFNLGTFFATRSFLLDGGLNCGPVSNIAIGIGGTAAGTQYDQIQITGAAQLNGAIFFNLENGYVPIPGDHFDVLTSPVRIGLFASSNGWDLGNDLYLAMDPATTSSESHPYRIRALRQKWIPIPIGANVPSPRQGHSAVYAPASDRLIVFGGQDGAGQVLNDVWRLMFLGGSFGDAAIWALVTPVGTPPPARKGHSAVYDAFNNRMIVFGGETDSLAYFTDVWVLTNADGSGGASEWLQLPTFLGPAPASGHAIGYNPTHNKMVMSQGGQYCWAPEGDMWVFDHANGLGTTTGWTTFSIPGTPPSPRHDSVFAYDPNGNRLIVYGGRVPCGSVLNDAFVLSNADGAPDVSSAWNSLGAGASPALPGLCRAPATYDPFFDRLVVFGGLQADGATLSSGVTLITATKGNAGWTELPLPSSRPAARTFHSMVHSTVQNRWIVFGGDANGTRMNDVWALELEGDAPQVSGIDPGAVSPGKDRHVLAFSASPSPNPASHGMQFSVHALQDVEGKVAVYDALGRRVVELFSGIMSAGDHRFEWKGEVASGIYFVALENGQARDVRRVVVAR
jgi:galactose oxidase-like protein